MREDSFWSTFLDMLAWGFFAIVGVGGLIVLQELLR